MNHNVMQKHNNRTISAMKYNVKDVEWPQVTVHR